MSSQDAVDRQAEPFPCQSACGACCIAPTITSPLPGMPEGKPAGVRCVHLDVELRCELFGRPERPDFCARFKPSLDLCGAGPKQAHAILDRLEQETNPLKVLAVD